MLQAQYATELKVEAGFRLGALRVDPVSGYIDGPGGRVEVDPRVMEVLVALARHPGELVSREQLFEEVWRDLVVSDETLTQCVYRLRRHFEVAGGDAQYRGWIATLPKRGYRLDREVEPADPGVPADQPPIRTQWRAAGLLTLLTALMVTWLLVTPSSRDGLHGAADSGATLPTVAVLPFADMSPKQDLAYFSDGISEEILHQLGGYRELQVIARTSSFPFKNSKYPIDQISELLGAQYLLQGSVRKNGDQLKINARLVDGSGWQRWSGSFDRELEDIFAIQEEIAQAVAMNIVPHVSSQATELAQPDIEAYQHYLVGREILHSQVPNWDNLAIEELRKAIEIAPDYAEAHAELAIALVYARDREWHLRTQLTTERKRSEAEIAIETALGLDSNLARAYAARGFLHAVRDQDEPAKNNLRRALALDPNMADAANWLVSLMLRDEDSTVTETWEFLVSATRRDPLFPALNNTLAWGYAQKGEIEQAQRTFERLLALPDPGEWTYHSAQIFYENTGQLVKAAKVAKRLVLDTAGTSRRDFGLNHLAEAYASMSMRDASEYWLSQKRQEGLHRHFDAFVLERQGRYHDILDLWDGLREHEGISLSDQHEEWVGYYGEIQALSGDIQGAINTLESVVTVDTEFSVIWGDPRVALAYAYKEAGAPDKAQPFIDRLIGEWNDQQADGLLNFSFDLVEFALVNSVAGDYDRAIALLEQAYAIGWRGHYSLEHDPRWDPLRDDPRFGEMFLVINTMVDAQKTEMEHIDADDDFTARFGMTAEAVVDGTPQNRVSDR
ncbi:MAG: winged helix-turn-helix domain-containing protein [Lysobacterales bacterium]